MICRDLKLLSTIKGDWELTLSITNKLDVQALQELTDVELLDITIKKHRNKKTRTQTAYLWQLCTEIAKVLHSTKEEIYRHAIREVGVYGIYKMKEDEQESFKRMWAKQGIGSYAEFFQKGDTKDTVFIIGYKGCSEYDTKQMSILIDYIVEEAKEQGIDTMSIDDIKEMKR